MITKDFLVGTLVMMIGLLVIHSVDFDLASVLVAR